MKFCRLCLFPMLLLLPLLCHGADTAKAFELPTDKGTVSLSSLKGQVVFVDFWASWCTPCRKSFPWMNEMQKRYQEQGLNIVAINLDQKAEQAQRFLQAVPAEFTVAYDPEGKTAELYNVQGMPSSYLIDRHGQLRQSHIGFRQKDKDHLEQAIIELLNEK